MAKTYEGIGITKGISTWKSQSHNVERFTDNAAFTSAHPDDTLVLAGPPRASTAFMQDANSSDPAKAGGLMAIGMLQGFQYSSQKPTQPLQAIGSGRLFFVSGKSQTQWNIGRLFCNGRNLLRVLYHNAVAQKLPTNELDDPASVNTYQDMHYINMDSELYYIPFGLSALYKDKAGDFLGGVYLELSMIQTYGIGFNAGQNMIMENVSGMCDRVLPIYPSDVLGQDNVWQGIRNIMDLTVGFVPGGTMPRTGTDYDDVSTLSNTDSEMA